MSPNPAHGPEGEGKKSFFHFWQSCMAVWCNRIFTGHCDVANPLEFSVSQLNEVDESLLKKLCDFQHTNMSTGGDFDTLDGFCESCSSM